MQDLFDVAGKTVVVTGGSRGIGAMIASGLVEAGATVVITARKAADLEALASELGERCIPIPADLSTEAGIRDLAHTVAAHTDRLHVLVNNAGASWAEPLDDYSRAGFRKVLDLNVTAVFQTTQTLLGLLRTAATADDPARVITIGSADGLGVPPRETYAYSASKAGVHHLTRHLAHTLAPQHITVNAIAPGYFPTPMTSFILDDDDLSAEVMADIPIGRWGTQDDIAGTVVWLSSRAGAYVTGAVISVDGGMQTTR